MTARPDGGGTPSAVRRGLAGAGWNLLAGGIQLAVVFVRATLLARWLPVEVFGTYALASAVVGLTSVGAAFGLGGAFLHWARETGDEESAAALHFTLRLLFVLSWAVLLTAGALLLAGGALRTALVLLTVTTAASLLAETPALVLVRRVRHARLAVLQVFSALASTGVALGLAWHGATLGALLAGDVAAVAVSVTGLLLWRPPWRPRLETSVPGARRFLALGAQTLVADGLAIALERVDRLWTGYRLGDAALGFYSRAHTFAGFVRRISTGSVGAVAGGIFAELAGDRRALSRAVVRTFAVAIRGGLLLGGAALLVAPEFIRLALGPRWLPMLPVLRFTLAFAVMEPVSALAVTLFLVLGRPRVVVRARLLQLGTLVPGLLVLSPLLGATGVALAVDAALLVGTVAMLRQASAEVDMSPRALIARPSAALVLGLAFGGIAGAASVGWRSDWGAAAAKAAVFAIVYGGVLGALERRHLAELAGAYAQWITTRVPRRPPEDAAGPA